MMDSKFWLNSRSVRGLIAAIVPAVMMLITSITGYAWAHGDEEKLVRMVMELWLVAGSAYAFYGTVKRRQRLRWRR